MKKSVIALAVAAALPVTAQADMTLSGSVKTSFENSPTLAKSLDIDAKLNLDTTEVLTNGMTATASFGILADKDDDTDNAGKVSLAGDFGTLTVGSSLDRDGAFQAGNIGNGLPVGLYETSSSASTSNAVHYSGDMAGLKVQAQVNASTNAKEEAVANNGASTQLSATYDINDLTFGYATTNANIATKNGDSGKVIEKGNVAGVSYSFGDLTVSYGKSSNRDDGTLSGEYSTTLGDVALSIKLVDYGTTTATSGSASYTMDALTVAVAYDSDKGASGSKMIAAGTKTSTITATYVAGDLTAKIGTKYDGSTDYSLALDIGNADLSIERDDSKSKTSMKYAVAF